ncbi:MAG: response regulator transcription factor [Opitutus sp.]
MPASLRHILLFEDSKDVRSAFIALFQQSYEVHVVASIDHATGLVTRRTVDCAVIDVAQGAEARSRMKMITAWRAAGIDVPVVMTSAVDGLTVEALAMGADDFLRKPFNFAELDARVQKQLARGLNERSVARRVDGVSLPQRPFDFGGATIHPDLRISFEKVTRRIGAKHVGILREFAVHAGQLVLKEQLVRAVWGADANTNSGSVHQYLHLLRKLYREGGIDFSEFVKPESKAGWRIGRRATCRLETSEP